MKKILVLQCHPAKESYCHALAEHYVSGALETGAAIELVHVHDLHYSPVLQYAYKKRTAWEPDLTGLWEKVKQADHLVIVYPTWWGGLPAYVKGLFDRMFLPGMAFQYQAKSRFQVKLMKNKTARIITTMDMPVWYYWLVYGAPGTRALKNITLKFCGYNPVKTTSLGSVKYRRQKQLKKWLLLAISLGRQMS
jgi:putative NADPH-quinone reductase